MLADPVHEQQPHKRKHTRGFPDSTQTSTIKQQQHHIKEERSFIHFTLLFICTLPKRIVVYCSKKLSTFVYSVLSFVVSGICAVPKTFFAFGLGVISFPFPGLGKKVNNFLVTVQVQDILLLWTQPATIISWTKGVARNIISGLITDALQVPSYFRSFVKELPGWNLVQIWISLVQTVVVYIFAVAFLASKKVFQFILSPLEFSKKVLQVLVKGLPLLPKLSKTVVLLAFDTFVGGCALAFRTIRSWVTHCLALFVDVFLKPGHLLGDIKTFLAYIMNGVMEIYLGVGIAAGVVLIAAGGFLCWWCQRRKPGDEEQLPITEHEHRGDSYGSNSSTERPSSGEPQVKPGSSKTFQEQSGITPSKSTETPLSRKPEGKPESSTTFQEESEITPKKKPVSQTEEQTMIPEDRSEPEPKDPQCHQDVRSEVQQKDRLEVQREDTPKVLLEDSPKVLPEDIPKVQTEDTPKVLPEDTPKVQSEDTPKVQPEDTPKVQTEDTPKVLPEDTPKVQSEDTPKVQPEDTPKVQSEDTPKVQPEDRADRYVSDRDKERSSKRSTEKYHPSKSDEKYYDDGRKQSSKGSTGDYRSSKSDERKYDDDERYEPSKRSTGKHGSSKSEKHYKDDERYRSSKRSAEEYRSSKYDDHPSDKERYHEEKSRPYDRPYDRPEEKVKVLSQLVLPESTYSDERIRDVWELMMKKLKAKLPRATCSVQPGYSARNQPGNPMRSQPGSLVVLPCIVASRVGSDVEAAVNSSELPGLEKTLLLLFHHKAKHNSKVFPTRDKGVGNREIEERLLDIIDFVFWQADGIYDCPTNQRAFQELEDAMTMK